MADNNETVEQVCEKMKEPSIYKGRLPASFFDGEFCEFADRILAAHKRELAVKDAEIERLKSCLAGDCERMRLGAEPCANCHIERVNERNEIIKELADALEIASPLANRDSCSDCAIREECNNRKTYPRPCLAQVRFNALIAKAREVIK